MQTTLIIAYFVVFTAAMLRAALMSATLAAATALTLDSYVVVQAVGENDAVQLALRDVESNLYTVTGVAPIFLGGPPAPGQLPPSTTVIYVGTTDAAPWLKSFAVPGGCTAGWEAHCVVAFPGTAPGTNGYASIVATGVGMRGGIFAAYTFTDVVLGFKPLYLFTDTPSPYVGGANVVVNDTLSVVYNPPRFQYRAPFLNDEDLSAVHRPDPLGRNVISLDTFDAFFQTALRMKANMFLIQTNPFPDSTSIALAARRGLVVTQHHYDLLGSNVFSWPLPSDDWSWERNAGTMAYLWRASIAAQANYPEVIWSVGMRGLNDMPYPACAADAEGPACGAAISDALSNQTQWLDNTPNQGNSSRMLYLWQELLPLLTKGYLTIPPGTDVVFTDAGSGYVRLDANWTEYATGCYYHTAMLDGTANQLTEMIPVSRIAQQLMNVVTYSKQTKIFVDNVSDLKPVPMTTAAVFDLVWDPTPWNATQDFNATARAWYARFGQDYAGLDAATAAQYALMWEAYFNVPYIFAGNSDNLLATLVARAGEAIAKDWATGAGVSSSTVAAVAGYVGQVGGAPTLQLLQGLNATAWQILPAVPAHRRGFYTSHVLVQFATQLASVNALVQMLAAAQALVPSQPGGAAPNPANGLALVNAALGSMDTLMALRRVTEGDAAAWTGAAAVSPTVNIGAAYPLRAFYLADTLSDMQAARGAVRTLQLSLQNPLKTPLLPVRPAVWYQFESYQQELAPNYPLAAFNPQWNLPTYTRINCRVSDQNASLCSNRADGGVFIKASGAAVTLQVMTSLTGEEPHPSTRAAMATKARLGLAPTAEEMRTVGGAAARDEWGSASLVIRYTTDGTAPTPSSPAYVPGQPPVLAQLLPAGQNSVTLKGMAWIDGVPTGQVTTTTWVGM